MVQQFEHWAELNVGAGKYNSFIFNVNQNQTDYKILINSNVTGTGHDITYLLCTYNDYTLYRDWRTNRFEYQRDVNGNIVNDKYGYPTSITKPFPNIQFLLNLRTNQIEKSFSLTPDSYVIIFDNSHSTITSKDIWLHVTESWDHNTISFDLSLIEQLIDELPTDVTTCVLDANNCYKAGHYNQCSIMLRKAIEIACKIKLLQSKTKPTQLIDKDGYEISLSKKIRLIQNKHLITQRNLKDLEQIKWFGDQSAHGSMQIVLEDIRDNVEPRVRSFLIGLNLKI